MSCANAHMLRITHSEINVTNIRIINEQYPKMIRRNKIPQWLAWNNANEMQCYLPK